MLISTTRPVIKGDPFLEGRAQKAFGHDFRQAIASDAVITARQFRLGIADDISISLPYQALIMSSRVLGTDFNYMVEGLDYDRRETRSLFYKLPETATVLGRRVNWLKYKGPCFSTGERLVPYTGARKQILPLVISFDEYGKVRSQVFPKYKPTNAMELDRAANEFTLSDIAFRNGAGSLLPVGLAHFTEAEYEGQPLGAYISALFGDELDLRAYFTSLIGEARPDEETDTYFMRIDSRKVRDNEGRINELFGNVGRTYHRLHDLGIFNHIPHPGNILVGGNENVFVNDHEYSKKLRDLTSLQEISYRLNEMRQFLLVFRVFLNYDLLSDLEKHLGISIAKAYFSGYFEGLPEADLGISILDGHIDTSNVYSRGVFGKEQTSDIKAPSFTGSMFDKIFDMINEGRDVSRFPVVTYLNYVVENNGLRS